MNEVRMKKRILSLAMAACLALSMQARRPMRMPLPSA